MANEVTKIGQTLRQARLNKNLSLDELQQITKIQRRYLEDIEAGDLESLPGTFYVRAFVRQYAQAVGEDGERLVAILDGKASFEPPLPKRPQPETVKGSRKALHVEESTTSPVIRLLPVIFFTLVAVTIIGVVVWMTIQDRNEDSLIKDPGSSVTVEQPKATSSSSSEAPKASSSTEASTTESSAEKQMVITTTSNTDSEANMTITDATNPLQLDFESTAGRCWVGVIVNGGYVYQYTLEVGDKQSTTLPENTQNATIVLGASANVAIKAGGQDLVFTEEGMAALRKNINLTIGYQQAAQ
ncbi:helix-turn-helix domain-containing protein [Enterococcus asini]|uniref:helix-turn-helix domain-containing protein n=1 Tax=Enterococcus asini TaxID=57732 RepID=UPI00288F9E82|nr:helix-turn-helix domain-containing protein [Enterococcus asini]MDT2764014.1 helix-turn-helix domain-containing protein [Enterococcus asini]